MNGNDNIEALFRKAFKGYRETPSPGLWNRLARKIAVREFFSFSWSSLNVYYVAALATAGIGAWLLLSPVKDHAGADNTVTVPENRMIPASPAKQDSAGPEAGAYEEDMQVKKTSSVDKKEKTVHVTENEPGRRSGVSAPQHGGREMQVTAKVERQVTPEGASGNRVSGEENNVPVPRPVAAFTSGRRAGCPPLTVKFHNRSAHYTSLLWHFNTVACTGTDPEFTFEEPGKWVVSLEVTGEDDSVRVAFDTITVYEPPVARFEMMKPERENEDMPVSFYNYSTDAVRSLWDFGDNTSSALSDPVHHFTGDGPYDVKLKVWSAEGCTDSMLVKNAFEKNPFYIRFPDAFVPNPNGPCDGYYTGGKNVNEVFHPVFFGVMDFNLRIFNRFGELVFESNDIRRGWDGYINGTMAKPDVYIWKARGTFANGKPFMHYGNVTLVKK